MRKSLAWGCLTSLTCEPMKPLGIADLLSLLIALGWCSEGDYKNFVIFKLNHK